MSTYAYGFCCCVLPGFDYLAPGHNMQDDDDWKAAQYDIERNGLLLCRYDVSRSSADRATTSPHWQITVPEVDASGSPDKNQIIASWTFIEGRDTTGDTGVAMACTGMVILGRAPADFTNGGPIAESMCGSTYSGTGASWSSVGSGEFLIGRVNCPSQSDPSYLTTISGKYLLLRVYDDITVTDDDSGAYTTALQNQDFGFALPLPGGGSVSDTNGTRVVAFKDNITQEFNARMEEIAYYGDKIGFLFSSTWRETSAPARPMVKQYATFSLTDGAWEFQQSTRDVSHMGELSGINQQGISTPPTAEWNDDARQVFDFDDNPCGSVLPWYYTADKAGATVYNAVLVDGTRYHYQEAKPFLLARGREDYACGVSVDSISADGSGTSAMTVSLYTGVITDNVVGGSAIFTSSTGSRNGFGYAAVVDFPISYDHRDGHDVLITTPGTVTASSLTLPGTSDTNGNVNAGYIQNGIVGGTNTTGDDRYANWYIDQTAVQVDKLSHISRNGEYWVFLHPQRVLVCPGHDGVVVVGQTLLKEISRSSAGVPSLPSFPLTGTLSADYLAYYDTSTGEPDIQWIRGGFLGDLLEFFQVNMDMVFMRDGNRFWLDNGINIASSGSPPTGSTVTVDTADPANYSLNKGGTPTVAMAKAGNWTMWEHDADGDSYTTYQDETPFMGAAYTIGIYPELGGVTESFAGTINFGVVPGRDNYSTRITEYPSLTAPEYNDDWQSDQSNWDDDQQPINTAAITIVSTAVGEFEFASDGEATWPGGVADGDVAYLIRLGPNNSTVVPTGWTKIDTGLDSTVRSVIYRRECDGTESGTFTVPVDASEDGENMVVFLGVFRGTEVGGSATYSPFAKTLALHHTSGPADAGGTWTTPTGYTTLHSGQSTGTNDFDYLFGHRDAMTISGVGDTTATHSVETFVWRRAVSLTPVIGEQNWDLDATGTPV